MNVGIICGSLRTASLNRMLLKTVEKNIGAEHSLNWLNLDELKLPVFNQDIEKDFIESVRKKLAPYEKVDVWVVASPEYNGSMSCVLKNHLDWISRAQLQFFAKKPVLLLSASPGELGGLRGLWHARHTFDVLNAYTHPRMVGIAKADQKIAQTKKSVDSDSGEAGYLELSERELGMIKDALSDMSRQLN